MLLYGDLPKIWSDPQVYPKRMYTALLHLMERFGLAFRLDSPKQPQNTYLVAELLGVDPVPPPEDWDNGDTLGFRYAYDFMPAGVMTRLIVSIHELLDEFPSEGTKRCWREGAYLRRGDVRAKIAQYSGIDKRYIDITIRGGDRFARREILTVIRDHVDRINARFNKIIITELVPCRCPQCAEAREPYFFRYKTLRKAAAQGRASYPCEESLEDVSITALLEGVEPMDRAERWDPDWDRAGQSVTVNIGGSAKNVTVETHGTHAQTGSGESKPKSLGERVKTFLESLSLGVKILAALIFAGIVWYLFHSGAIGLKDLPKLFGNFPG